MASENDITRRGSRCSLPSVLCAVGLCLGVSCLALQASHRGWLSTSRSSAFVVTLSNCQDFFLTGGRSFVELPGTWAEGRSEFRDMCMSEGFSVEGCQNVEGVIFKDVPRDSTPMNATENFCAKLTSVGKAATFLDQTNLSHLRENSNALVAAVEGLLERTNSVFPRRGVDGQKKSYVSLDMALEQKVAPVELYSSRRRFHSYSPRRRYYNPGGTSYGGGGQNNQNLFFMVLAAGFGLLIWLLWMMKKQLAGPANTEAADGPANTVEADEALSTPLVNRANQPSPTDQALWSYQDQRGPRAPS
eukprot:TRINITY_DN8003_c0_g1_i2.p1 TRINITY_DN8003_c0_g1~~TRINITY_DN8003_c0_g1_i2.p1  ORF type:complete len:327 (-),score=31.97 TRINITY_DN8003_c0_g1_i2:155-1063(-)